MSETKEPVDRYEEAVALLEKTHRELEAKLDEVERLKTAIHIANGWYELCNVKLPGTEHNLKTYFQEQIDNLFVGTVSAFAMKTPPDGWLECNGDAVSRETYWKLFQRISTTFGEGDGSTTFNLPDMRGLFVRGHDPNGKHDSKREFASYQSDQIQSHSHTDYGHNHGGNISSEGNHSHSASTEPSGVHSHSGIIDKNGIHSHNLDRRGNDLFKATGFYENYQGSNSPRQRILSSYKGGITGWYWDDKYAGYISSTDSADSHAHSLSINSDGSHSHSVNLNSAGSHSHSVTINTEQANLSNPTNARHGSETRVKNIALIYCIKY